MADDHFTMAEPSDEIQWEEIARGRDGVSPVITVIDITGGHRVTITDAEHPQGQSFDVMDGDISGVGNLAFLNYVVVES